MTDEEFQREVEALVDLLNSLRLIRDKGRKQWLKAAIRTQMRMLLRD